MCHAWLTREQGRGSPQPRPWRSGDGGGAGRPGPGKPELAPETRRQGDGLTGSFWHVWDEVGADSGSCSS